MKFRDYFLEKDMHGKTKTHRITFLFFSLLLIFVFGLIIGAQYCAGA